MQRRLLTVREAAEYLGISTHFVYKRAARKEIPHVKIGGRLLFDIKRLDQMIEENAIEPVDWTKFLHRR